MLLPKRVKYRKQHRGRMTGKATRGNKVSYGQYGLLALEPCWMTSNQIEAARIAINRHLKRGGTVWIKVFPDKPVTAKPAETRMGSGKGTPEYWVAVVKPGRVLFELAGVPEDVAREALRLASHKLPIKCKFVKSDRTLSAEEYARYAAVQADVIESIKEADAEAADAIAAEDTSHTAAPAAEPAAEAKEGNSDESK